MKNKAIWFLIGLLTAIIIVLGLSCFTGYKKSIDSMLGTLIVYKNESITTHLSSDVCDHLTDGKKEFYFGQLPSKEQCIEFNSPKRADIYIYPFDEKSIIVKYKPRYGVSRIYKVFNQSGFNGLLHTLYELTDHPIFN